MSGEEEVLVVDVPVLWRAEAARALCQCAIDLSKYQPHHAREHLRSLAVGLGEALRAVNAGRPICPENRTAADEATARSGLTATDDSGSRSTS